jgi:hypothetical protein
VPVDLLHVREDEALGRLSLPLPEGVHPNEVKDVLPHPERLPLIERPLPRARLDDEAGPGAEGLLSLQRDVVRRVVELLHVLVVEVGADEGGVAVLRGDPPLALHRGR